jgi:ferritin-like protein
MKNNVPKNTHKLFNINNCVTAELLSKNLDLDAIAQNLVPGNSLVSFSDCYYCRYTFTFTR